MRFRSCYSYDLHSNTYNIHRESTFYRYTLYMQIDFHSYDGFSYIRYGVYNIVELLYFENAFGKHTVVVRVFPV